MTKITRATRGITIYKPTVPGAIQGLLNLRPEANLCIGSFILLLGDFQRISTHPPNTIPFASRYLQLPSPREPVELGQVSSRLYHVSTHGLISISHVNALLLCVCRFQ